MSEYKSIRKYLEDLKNALNGLDTALIADALDDTKEHLEFSLEENLESGEYESTSEALQVAIRKYGFPAEIADEYRKVESEKKMEKPVVKKHSKLYQLFAVYLQPKTYLHIGYLLLQFPLGLLYFMYIIIAVLMVAVLLITWIGIPLGILFLLSIFGLAWFHGRVSEAFLGIRMPQKRKNLMPEEATQQNSNSTLQDLKNIIHFTSTKTWEKMKAMLKDRRLYTSLLYLFLTFPLGIIYFCGFALLFSSAISLIISPLADTLIAPLSIELFNSTWDHVGLPWFGTTPYTIAYPVLGIILFTGALHLSNILAIVHGTMTKELLVKR
jgi:uncharacterized membrane protein